MKKSFSSFCNKILFFCVLFTLFLLPIYNSLTSVGLGFCIFFLILSLSASRDFRLPGQNSIIVIVFFMFSLVMAIFSPCRAESIKGLNKLILYVLLYASVRQSLSNNNRIKSLIYLFIFSCLVVSIDGLYQFISGVDWFSARQLMSYPHLGIKRITASFHQAGSLGIHLGPAIAMALSLFLFNFSRPIKFALAVLIVLMLTALCLTFAPGAAIGLYAAILIMAIAKNNKFLIAIFLICLISGFYFLPESLTNWPNGSLFASISGRIEMWKTVIKIISNHPFVGSGLHTFPLNYQQFCSPGAPHCGGGAPYAHNMYLQMLAEIGLIGFSIFACLIVSTIKNLIWIFKNDSRGINGIIALGLIGGISAYLTHGLLESSFYTSQGALLFWLMLGLCHSLKKC